jgi:nucleoside-diphosphate-sugar epimerase
VKALVTGASGFIGSATCAELAGRGHEVVALVRRRGSEPPDTRARPGDLTDAASLQNALAGERPDCVVHLAAEIASQRSERRIQEVNVEGTRRLLEACEFDGAPRFVLASTVVTGDARGALLEPDKPLPVETPYGRSKQEAEKLLGESGLHGVVVRPSHVYGPGGWYAEEFVKRLRQPGRFAVIGKGDNWWDVVRVEDVASALADAAERAPAGAVYHVVDDEPIKFYDFIALTAAAMGLGAPRRVPTWLASVAGGRNAVAAAVRSARSSNRRLKEELGWSRLPERRGRRAGRDRQARARALTPIGLDERTSARPALSRHPWAWPSNH